MRRLTSRKNRCAAFLQKPNKLNRLTTVIVVRIGWLAIATAAWGFERHLVVGLHHHLACFAHRLPVYKKATRRAGGATAQAFRRQLHAARDRVEQPRTAGAHAPDKRLAIPAARCPRTTRARAQLLLPEDDRHGGFQYLHGNGGDAGRITCGRRTALGTAGAPARRKVVQQPRRERPA